jgi:hypothetical protein
MTRPTGLAERPANRCRPVDAGRNVKADRLIAGTSAVEMVTDAVDVAGAWRMATAFTEVALAI